MSSSPPDVLGQYQIIREIARSNDIVYEGYDPAMNRRVAVKELAFPGGSSDQQRQDRIKRFLREAKAAGSLVHPNIVTVYNVAEQDGRFYLAMEYLDGQTLRKRLESGPIPQDDAIEIAIEILKALAFAHSNGVVHRDVKPENIQILESGAIKLTDFGIARLTFEPNITMDGQVFGTPSYMSPEQINGRDIDPRSDLFSIGIVLYEMLTGKKPFAGDSVVAITHAIMNFDPPAPANLNFTIWSVVAKSLEKSPQLRQSSAEEMIAELKQALRSLSSPVLDPLVAAPVVVQPPDPYAGNAQYTPYGTPNPYYNPSLPTAPASPSPGAYGNPPTQQYNYGAQSPPQTIYAPYPGPSQPTPYPQPYGQPYAQPYPQGGGFAPPPQIPVYYPPPPRKLITINPDVVATLGRFVVALVVIGLVIGLIIFVVNALGEAGTRFTNQRSQNASIPFVRTTPPVPRRTDVGSAPSEPVSQPPRAPQSPTADRLLSEAVQLIRSGASQSSIELRTEDWRAANSRLTDAIRSSPGRVAEIKSVASAEYQSAAREMEEQGNREGARAALYQAIAFANSSESRVLQEWMGRLGD